VKRKLVQASKFLALVLRHQPQRIGLAVDDAGWARVSELIGCARRSGVELSEAVITEVVEKNEKQRFKLSEDGTKIRASQGHSLPIDLGLEPVRPPDVLYHGTATRFLPSIRERGLTSRGRQYVHLSPDEDTATRVGQRHGQPVVLRIQAALMYAHGHEFFLSENGVWLTREVPLQFVDFG
jgi:putative RNA 2'-phosphotransferase